MFISFVTLTFTTYGIRNFYIVTGLLNTFVLTAVTYAWQRNIYYFIIVDPMPILL